MADTEMEEAPAPASNAIAERGRREKKAVEHFVMQAEAKEEMRRRVLADAKALEQTQQSEVEVDSQGSVRSSPPQEPATPCPPSSPRPPPCLRPF